MVGKQAMRTPRQRLIGFVASVVAGIFAVSVGVLVASTLVDEPAALGAPAAAPPITRQQVIAATKGRQTIATRIDRIEAKLTTWMEFQIARGVTDEFIAAMQPDREIWLVSVSGEFRPQLARGEVFRWGIVAYDANTGADAFTFAGHESWPDMFARVRDRGK